MGRGTRGGREVSCTESLSVQAYFDGETDAPSAAGIERHLQGCAECRGLLQDLERARASIRADARSDGAPPALRARIMRTLGAAGATQTAAGARHGALWRLSSFWIGAGAGVGCTALATVALLWLASLPGDTLVDALVSAHVGSLLPGHLIGVESTDHHTVKPWFAGRADVSPAVEDFTGEGFRLVGGRADYLPGQRAAVVVYRHGLHVINVFSWRGGTRPVRGDITRNGYHMDFWTEGDLQYCAVSDTAWPELHQLDRLLRGLAP